MVPIWVDPKAGGPIDKDTSEIPANPALNREFLRSVPIRDFARLGVASRDRPGYR
jgi:hypothetical protein